MIEKFLQTKLWSTEFKIQFLNELNSYTNDEKCFFVYEAANNLLKSQKDMNLIIAEDILVYATQHFNNVEDSNKKALVYYKLGELYEVYKEDYIKAYTYYKKYELNNTEMQGIHSLLLRVLLLRDNFTYSEEMEKELKLSYGETDLGLRKDRIYENIGSLIIAEKENDTQLCEKLIKRIKAIVKGDELFFLDLIFRKDTVNDSLKPPKKLIDYVKSL